MDDVDLRRSPRDRHRLQVDSGPDFAAIFGRAYRESHGGKDAAYTLLANVSSTANNLLARGCPADDLEAAVSCCARTNRGAGLLDVVLAEVQGGETRSASRGRSRADILRSWEARHAGAYE